MKKINKMLSFAIVAVMLLQIAAGIAGAVYVDTYMPKFTAVIGTPGKAVSVGGDGSFSCKCPDENGNEISLSASFGFRGISDFSYPSVPYPVVSQTFSEGDDGKVLCTLEQFALYQNFKDEYGVSRDSFVVFSHLTCENGGKEEYILPETVGARKYASDEEKTKAEPGEKLTVDYYTCEKNIVTEKTYEEYKEDMTSFWDEYFKEKPQFKGLSEIYSNTEKELRKTAVENAVNSSSNTEEICFETAYNILRGENCDTKSAIESADKTLAEISALPGGESLILSDSVPIFETNAEALIKLKSAEYISRARYNNIKEKEYKDAYNKLLNSVEAALKKTKSSVGASLWASDTTGNAESGTFSLNGKDYASAKAMCKWYVLSSQFNGDISQTMTEFARDAFKYIKCSSKEALVNSFLQQTEKGTVVVGKGLTPYLFAKESKISLENVKISPNETIGVSLQYEKGEMKISLDSENPMAFAVEIPFLQGNIEYSSIGFDSSTGIVTIPEGVNDITIRMTEDAETLIKEADGNAQLERAIAECYNADTSNCTFVSKNIFDSAYENALSARAGTAEGKIKAANSLALSHNILSKTVAEYSIDFSKKEDVGVVTSGTIMQKFRAVSDGKVEKVTVSGDFREGTFAAIYTLRKDGYTTDRMVGETDGVIVDAGIEFNFSAETEANTDYVLAIYNEAGEVSAAIVQADAEEKSLYTHAYGEENVFCGATLKVCFKIIQADRSALEGLYKKCANEDVADYTKESVKLLKSALEKAKTSLCTKSVSVKENEKVYKELKSALSGLSTYASDEDKIMSPIGLQILIACGSLVIIATTVTVVIVNMRKYRKEKEANKL